MPVSNTFEYLGQVYDRVGWAIPVGIISKAACEFMLVNSR